MTTNGYLNRGVSITGNIVTVQDIPADHVQISYVNGGITYPLPPALIAETEFSSVNNLNVVASVVLINPFNPLITYNSLITAVTSSSVTIQVNKIDGTGPAVVIGEAATGEIIVSLSITVDKT